MKDIEYKIEPLYKKDDRFSTFEDKFYFLCRIMYLTLDFGKMKREKEIINLINEYDIRVVFYIMKKNNLKMKF